MENVSSATPVDCIVMQPSVRQKRAELHQAGFMPGESAGNACCDCRKQCGRGWWQKVSYEYDEWECWCRECAYARLHQYDDKAYDDAPEIPITDEEVERLVNGVMVGVERPGTVLPPRLLLQRGRDLQNMSLSREHKGDGARGCFAANDLPGCPCCDADAELNGMVFDLLDALEATQADAERWRYIRDNHAHGMAPQMDGTMAWRFTALKWCVGRTPDEVVDKLIRLEYEGKSG